MILFNQQLIQQQIIWKKKTTYNFITK